MNNGIGNLSYRFICVKKRLLLDDEKAKNKKLDPKNEMTLSLLIVFDTCLDPVDILGDFSEYSVFV